MPVTIKTGVLNYKDSYDQYVAVDVVSDNTTASRVAAINSAADTKLSAIEQTGASTISQVETAVADSQAAVAGIDAQRNTMIAAIASVAGQGTDTTLSQSGVAADAKAVGDLKSALNVLKETVKDEVTLKLSSAGVVYQAFEVKAGTEYLIVNKGGTVGINLRTVNATGSNIEIINTSFPATGIIVWTPQNDAPRMAVQYASGGDIYVSRLGAINQNVSNILFSLAPEYSPSNTYSVGNVVQYCGMMKVCKTTISTAEPFNSSKWNNFTISGQFATVRNQIEENNSNISGAFSELVPQSIITGEKTISFSDWEEGSIDYSGNDTTSTTALRSRYYHQIAGDSLVVSITAGYSHVCNIYWYSYINGSYTYVSKSDTFAGSYTVVLNPSYYYRFVLTKTNAESTADINTAYFAFKMVSASPLISQFVTVANGVKTQSNSVQNVMDLSKQIVPLSAVSGEHVIAFDDWEAGTISASGKESDSTKTLRSKYYHAFVGDTLTLSITVGHSHTANIIWYSFANGVYTYVGQSMSFASSYSLDINKSYYYRFVVTATNATSTDDINLSYYTFAIKSTDSIAERYANEDILSPDYELIDLPSGVGTWQSIEHVEDEVWLCNESSTVGGTINGKIYRVSEDFSSYIGELKHNIGHLNGVSYDSGNKRFLTGSGSNNASETPKIWIYENADEWLEVSAGGSISFDNLEKTEIDLSSMETDYGELTYITPCWGERNANGNRSIYINAGLNTKWFRIIPRMGITEGEYGTYTASESGKYNGSFDVVEYYTYDNHQINETIDSYVCQGMTLYKGTIIEAMSHSCILAGRYTKNLAGVMKRDIIRMQYVDDSGAAVANTQNEGIMVMNGCIYSGLSNATTPKLAKWQI